MDTDHEILCSTKKKGTIKPQKFKIGHAYFRHMEKDRGTSEGVRLHG